MRDGIFLWEMVLWDLDFMRFGFMRVGTHPLGHSFEEFLSKLFIKNQIEKCDLPNCFMCIMMKGPFFWGISLQNILLKLRMGHSFEEKNDGPFFWDTLVSNSISSISSTVGRPLI